MRRLPALLLCCVLASGCSKLVDVKALPIELQPVDTPQQSFVYAADGTAIATLRYANRSNVRRADLPDVLVDAVVAAEDRTFFTHAGVNARAIVRAALANRRAGRVVQGGSTITQQLVKNRYFPHAEQTLERKAREARLALELERSSSKDAILVDYLNTVYFGSGAYGVQAAAGTYFARDAAQLSLPQAALLAGLIRAPDSASPHKDPARALRERARVLDAMVSAGLLDAAAAQAAAQAPLDVQPPPSPPRTRFPYFVETVKRTLLSDPRFGPDEAARARLLFGGGLRIHTTIEPGAQAAADHAARALLFAPDDPEVAIALVRPSDGHVLATVGGRDFAVRQFDLATQARRQPGSTFKTFALVAALRAGMRLDDAVDSGSVRLRPRGAREPWHVRSNTSGLITLRHATAKSSNGAFARLALRFGPEEVAAQARAMGITSEIGANPAIVLGGVRPGVSVLEMASSYGTLAAGGVHVPPVVVTRITNADGHLVWEPDARPRVVMEGETAWYATQALRAVVEEGTGKAAQLGRPAAGKTGTSQNNRDAWFVGYTPELAAAVWVGYPDYDRPLVHVRGRPRIEGGNVPAEVWKLLMEQVLAQVPPREFTYPDHEARSVVVDAVNGELANKWCPLTVRVTALPAELPTAVCSVHGPPPVPEPATPDDPAPATTGASPGTATTTPAPVPGPRPASPPAAAPAPSPAPPPATSAPPPSSAPATTPPPPGAPASPAPSSAPPPSPSPTSSPPRQPAATPAPSSAPSSPPASEAQAGAPT